MENKLTAELLEKAKQAKTPEELAALAKENGEELTAESAKAYFDLICTAYGNLADDELDNVSGGRRCGTTYYHDMPVVTCWNSCEHYFYKDWEYVDGRFKYTKRGSGHCDNCHYYAKRAGGWLYVCTCTERLND